MPELPDITAYLTALTPRVVGHTLQHIRIGSPLLLRTAWPPITAVEGLTVSALRRTGKRIVFCFSPELNSEDADRSLSRLLGADWPRTLDELEALKRK